MCQRGVVAQSLDQRQACTTKDRRVLKNHAEFAVHAHLRGLEYIIFGGKKKDWTLEADPVTARHQPI